MKKRLKTLALSLSALFFALPICACGAQAEEDRSEYRGEIGLPDPEPDLPDDFPIPDLPKTEDPQSAAPNAPNAELPKSDGPEQPKSDDPEQPKSDGPVSPENSENPKTEAPEKEEPKAEEPEKPKVETPSEPTSTLPQTQKAEYVKIAANGLNVRTGAGSGYSSLGTVQKGELLRYQGKEGNWYKTSFRGRTAYVSAGYAELYSLDMGAKETEAVISEGLLRLGVPYVYGATRYHDGKGNLLKGFTTSAFDCSSLMQYIFYQGAGKKLNMTTRTQVSQGKSVKKADIERGDLLFFTNDSRRNKTGIERVGHVALYLGENYILHTASDYAKIEQISAKRWSYFLEARRV